MRYGLPYKGSKNKIATWVVDNLPAANTFVDLFFGGGAVTHAAMLSGKYKNYIANDIDSRLIPFFVDCCNGRYTIDNHSEWISREEFFAKKDTDAYIAFVWSFGNNGKDYLYGKSIEPYKKAYHYAVYKDKPELLKEYGFDIKSSHFDNVYERYLEFRRQIDTISKKHCRLQSCEQLRGLQNFNNLDRIQKLFGLQHITGFCFSYDEVDIPDDAVVYCDPPYLDTACDNYAGFDSERFYEWARNQKNIFISEYTMPDDFIPLAKKEKIVTSGTGNKTIATETIWTNEKTYREIKSDAMFSNIAF